MFVTRDPDWRADVARVGGSHPVLKELSLWAIWVYRFGRRTDRRPEGIIKRILTVWYFFLFRCAEIVTGISILKDCTIGPGIRIYHFGCVFIHNDAIIGSHCTLRQGVTIGGLSESSGVPTVGDNVEFGAFAQVLGPVIIGNGCRIGTLCVVVSDVPDGGSVLPPLGRVMAGGRSAGAPKAASPKEPVLDTSLAAARKSPIAASN